MLDLFEAEIVPAIGESRAHIDRQVDELRTVLEQRPATLPDWRTILADIRERLTSLALLLHELDEPAASTGAGLAPHVSTWNEAGFWLERAEAAVAGRHAELERLTGWMTTVSGLLPSVMSLKVPSIAGVIRSCDLALEDLAAHRKAAGSGRSSKKHADMPGTSSNAPTASPPSPTTCSRRSSSASSSTRSASSSRSATTSSTAVSTTLTTTSSRRKHASPATWRSRSARCRTSTGSSSDAR